MAEEVKIVYLEKRREGEQERAIRGRVIKETDDFITIQRDDGEFSISKRVITRIERPRKRSAQSDESDCDGEFDGESYR